MPKVNLYKNIETPQEVQQRKIKAAQVTIKKAMLDLDIENFTVLAEQHMGMTRGAFYHCFKVNRWTKEQFKGLCRALKLTDEQKNIIWEVA